MKSEMYYLSDITPPIMLPKIMASSKMLVNSGLFQASSQMRSNCSNNNWFEYILDLKCKQSNVEMLYVSFAKEWKQSVTIYGREVKKGGTRW